jgi:hypothetical protein
MQKQCVSIPGEIDDKCESVKVDELGIQTKLLKDVIGEFDTKYKVSREQLREHISKQLTYYQDVIVSLIKIETNNMLKYNNQQLNNTTYNGNFKQNFANQNTSTFGQGYSTTFCTNIKNYTIFFIFSIIIYLFLEKVLKK